MKFFRNNIPLLDKDFESEAYMADLARDYAARKSQERYYDEVSSFLNAQ